MSNNEDVIMIEKNKAYKWTLNYFEYKKTCYIDDIDL